jgi:hypothetical protein
MASYLVDTQMMALETVQNLGVRSGGGPGGRLGGAKREREN